MGLRYQPWDTDEYGTFGVMIIGRERLKFLKKYLPQCHIVHLKSHLDYPGIEDGRSRRKASN
jgi:hypothetical protein